MLAQAQATAPATLFHTFGDAHIYSNHFEQVQLQLARSPLPIRRLNPEVKDIFSFRFEDFTLDGYDPHPHLGSGRRLTCSR